MEARPYFSGGEFPDFPELNLVDVMAEKLEVIQDLLYDGMYTIGLTMDLFVSRYWRFYKVLAPI